MSVTGTLAALHKSLTVDCDVEHAFRMFTEEIASWWPTHSHSVGGDKVVTVVFDGRLDGSVYEQQADGTITEWGRILEWDPPHRLVLAWHPARDASEATQVEVRFVADGEATRVELEHRGWEIRGEKAADARASYETGWDDVLGYYDRKLNVS